MRFVCGIVFLFGHVLTAYFLRLVDFFLNSFIRRKFMLIKSLTLLFLLYFHFYNKEEVDDEGIERDSEEIDDEKFLDSKELDHILEVSN